MKTLSLLFYLVLSVVLLYGAVCPIILAKSPKTAKIAFVSARDFNREIYLMNPDGSEQVNLTKNLADDLFPVWSPTGEQILFVSDRDGVRDLYLMDADGKNVEKVFKQSARREHPTWAPDGKQIAYERGGFIYIATIGKQIEELVVSDGFDPAWSPDGREIALTLNPFTHVGEIYQANALADWFDPVTLGVLPQPQLLPIEWGEIKKR